MSGNGCRGKELAGRTFNVSSLPIMEKGEQFLRVIGIFLYYVATIKLAYNENYPRLNSINMLL
jgi:hypothetical protein